MEPHIQKYIDSPSFPVSKARRKLQNCSTHQSPPNTQERGPLQAMKQIMIKSSFATFPFFLNASLLPFGHSLVINLGTEKRLDFTAWRHYSSQTFQLRFLLFLKRLREERNRCYSVMASSTEKLGFSLFITKSLAGSHDLFSYVKKVTADSRVQKYPREAGE